MGWCGRSATANRRRRPYPGRAMSRIAPLLAACAALLVPGCVTGDRPTLAESASTTGDPAVDAVLGRLDASRLATFTAELRRADQVRQPHQPGRGRPGRRRSPLGHGRRRCGSSSTAPTTATCQLDTGTCSDTIDAGRISNTQLAPDFYGSSAAARLRREAAARVGAASASTQSIAGQVATCVSIPVTGSTSVYCALDDGAAGPPRRRRRGDRVDGVLPRPRRAAVRPPRRVKVVRRPRPCHTTLTRIGQSAVSRRGIVALSVREIR